MRTVLPSAAMFERVARLAPVCLLAAIACRPEPTPVQGPSEPDAVAADPGGPTVARDDAIGDEPDDEADGEDLASELAGESAAAGEQTEAQQTEEPSAEAQLEPANTTQPVAKKQRQALPKPIHKRGSGKCVQTFAVGEKVKNFRLPSLAGDKTISPSGYRNRVVLLNFWATWCKPCLEELPEFDRLYRKYRSHGLTLVAVTTDEDPKPVQAFVDQHKLIAKVALGGEQAAEQYNRPNFPFSLLVDGNGTIVASFDYVSDACLGDLEQVIRDSLADLQ